MHQGPTDLTSLPLNSDAAATAELFARIDAIVDELSRHLIETRHMLHMHPEVAWTEHETAAEIRRFLAEMGAEFRTEFGRGLGTVVDIGPSDGPRVGYRSDIDALPIEDEKPVPYRSRREGVMHACGHDAHTTIGLGLAEVFHRLRDSLPGGVRIVFQPAEEVSDGGARVMVADGASDGLNGMWAVHVDPTLEPRTYGLKSGTLTAAVDGYVIRIHGKSSHSARPHLGVDPIMLASRCISALYQTVQTSVDPYQTGVLNVGRIRGGEASNIIAPWVEFEGTIRCFEPVVRARLRETLEKVVRGICEPLGATVEYVFSEGPPTVRNDEAMIDVAGRAVADALGSDAVVPLKRPSTGGDDFSMYQLASPVCMLRAGCRVGEGHGLHTPLFDVADDTIPETVRVMARCMVLDLMRHRRNLVVDAN